MSRGGGSSPVLLEIADDRLSARLVVDAGAPPDETSCEAIEAMLKEAGIELSEVTARLVRTASEVIAAEPDRAHELPIARGVAPKHGQDGALVFEPGRDPGDPDAEHGSKEGQEGAWRVSHYDRSAFACVTEGDVIGRLVAPTEHEDGRDIYGETLAATAGEPAKLRFGDGLQEAGDGTVIAQAAGVLHRTGDTLTVRRSLEIAQCVDFSTGHVEFDGDVEIGDGVRDLFRVRATGTIVVRGLVEAAHLESGEDCVLSGGMAARDRGSVTAGRDLIARHLSNVRGDIGRNLVVNNEIINCRMMVGERLVAEQCTLSGGMVLVAGNCTLARLGARSGVRTVLMLGDRCRVAALMARMEGLRPEVLSRVERLESEVERLRRVQQHRAGQASERLVKLQTELHTVRDLMGMLDERAGRLLALVDGPMQINLVVARSIYRGVRLGIGTLEVRFREEVGGPVQITCNQHGEPMVRLASGSLQPLASVPGVFVRESSLAEAFAASEMDDEAVHQAPEDGEQEAA